MHKGIIQAEKEQVISQICNHVPLIRPFFGIEQNLREYSHNLYDFTLDSVFQSRQNLIKKVIQKKVENLFGQEKANQFNINLNKSLVTSIVDHHMVLNHPLLVSGNLMSNVEKYLNNTKPEAILVISSGDIPPNNFFSKNGFMLGRKRVPIFSTSEREHTSHYITKRDFDFVNRLKVAKRWHEFNVIEQAFLINLEKRIQALDFNNCHSYNDQISVIVNNTWPLLFEEKLRLNTPELIYVTQEEVVKDCLIDLLQEDNIISTTLFDALFRDKILDNFRGIVTTWRESEQKGTHFFWRKYPGEPRSIRMYLNGDYLVPQDSRHAHLKVKMDKDEIIDLLQKDEIYPSLFTIFAVLCFYAGVKPLTGHGSAVYLELFKQAWLKTLADTNYEEEKNRIEQISITGLICGPILVFERQNGKLVAPYAHDLMYNGGIKQEYLEHLFNMKFNQVLSLGLPDMYDYFKNKYIPENEKLNLTISSEDLAKLTFDWV